VLVGFEETPDCVDVRLFDGFYQNLTGMSVRQALDYLLALAPRYAWRALDGVAVVRPAVAWHDRTDVLNLYLAPFSVTNVHPNAALLVLLHMPVSDAWEPPGQPLTPRSVSATFSGGTLLDALNTVIRAHQDAGWNVRLESQATPVGQALPTVKITMTTFDVASITSYGIRTPLARLYSATGGGSFSPR
jgi:hypothetical protein